MSKEEILHAAGVEAAKGAPPIVVATGAQVQGWSSADLIAVLTIIYLVLQILWLLWRWRKAAKSDGIPTEGQG